MHHIMCLLLLLHLHPNSSVQVSDEVYANTVWQGESANFVSAELLAQAEVQHLAPAQVRDGGALATEYLCPCGPSSHLPSYLMCWACHTTR